MQARINDFDEQYDSDDIQHLSAEEVHCIIKDLSKLFCFALCTNCPIQYTFDNMKYDKYTYDSEYDAEEVNTESNKE